MKNWLPPRAEDWEIAEDKGNHYLSIKSVYPPGVPRRPLNFVLLRNHCFSDFTMTVRLRQRKHREEKPLALMEALVRDFTDPGELIADPFAGSGTTLVAAKRLGRRAMGWEIDPGYHAIAVKRIAAAREQYQLPLSSEPEPKQQALTGTAAQAPDGGRR